MNRLPLQKGTNYKFNFSLLLTTASVQKHLPLIFRLIQRQSRDSPTFLACQLLVANYCVHPQDAQIVDIRKLTQHTHSSWKAFFISWKRTQHNPKRTFMMHSKESQEKRHTWMWYSCAGEMVQWPLFRGHCRDVIIGGGIGTRIERFYRTLTSIYVLRKLTSGCHQPSADHSPSRK